MNKTIQLQSNDGVDNLFPTMKMDLLWTNASPTSNFAPQTISLDLSEYNILIIMCYSSTTLAVTTPIFSGIAFKNVTNQGIICGRPQNHAPTRYITNITNSGVIFGNGQALANLSDYNNNEAIPYKIYGIKGVIE